MLGDIEVQNEREPVLRLRGVEKSYETRQTTIEALGPVDLDIHSGEFVSIVGPSGCGKSTLLSIMSGLEKPSGGEVVNGAGTTSVVNAGVVFQRDLLLDWRTCVDNVLLQCEMRRMKKEDSRGEALRLLEMVGIEQFASAYPWQLSGGMRQRVAICRALVHRPTLLFMDEPFGALDAITREVLNEDLSVLVAERGVTTVFVTHDIEEAVLLSDRVLVSSPRPGRLVADVAVPRKRPRKGEDRFGDELVGVAQELRRHLRGSGAFAPHTDR